MRNEYEYQSFEEYAKENPSSMAVASTDDMEIAMVAEVQAGPSKAKTLFDTGTRGLNLISKNYTQVHQIPTTPIPKPYKIDMTTKGSKTTAYERAEIEVSIRPGQTPWKVTCEVLPSNA